jgi:type I restriction enzyme R subunit
MKNNFAFSTVNFQFSILLQTKYQSLEDAMEILGDVQNISSLFIEFQKHLYDIKVA